MAPNILPAGLHRPQIAGGGAWIIGEGGTTVQSLWRADYLIFH